MWALSKKERRALSNRMQRQWADALTERLWRIRVWMREQERARNIDFGAIRDSHLSQLPREVRKR